MWSKKWYLKRNISCDAHLLNELLETDVPWDDAIVVSAGKLRKLWYSLGELRSSLCERRLERTVLRPALLPVKTAQFTQFFPCGMTSHSKIVQFQLSVWGRFRPRGQWDWHTLLKYARTPTYPVTSVAGTKNTMTKFSYDCKVSVGDLKPGPQTTKKDCEVADRDVRAFFDTSLYLTSMICLFLCNSVSLNSNSSPTTTYLINANLIGNAVPAPGDGLL
jgi:hypothetical protein